MRGESSRIHELEREVEEKVLVAEDERWNRLDPGGTRSLVG